MLFHEFGSPEKPTVILLHGAGVSWWAYRDTATLLEKDYHMVLPVIDGYGEDAWETFESIERSAQNLMDYVQARHRGHVFAVGGLSLGAQIAAEALSQHSDLADFAVLESALTYPIALTAALTLPMVKMSYGLIRKRWFAEMQAKALQIPEDQLEEYCADSMKITLETLLSTLRSNGSYTLKAGLAKTQARALILAGEKEMAVMRRSAQGLHQALPGSTLRIIPGMKHGELSMRHPETYARLLKAFFSGQSLPETAYGEPSEG